MSDMEMGYDVSGTQSFKFSIPGWGFMAAEGNCLDAKYTHIFRKYWFLHNLFFFVPLIQRINPWDAAQRLREKVGHSLSHICFLSHICTKILHGKPQVLPVPKNLQIM